MLELGATIGRQHAHDVVYDAAQAAFVEGRSFGDLLAADRRVTEHLDAAAIAALLDPTKYTGLCARDGARGGGPGEGCGGAIVVDRFDARHSREGDRPGQSGERVTIFHRVGFSCHCERSEAICHPVTHCDRDCAHASGSARGSLRSYH